MTGTIFTLSRSFNYRYATHAVTFLRFLLQPAGFATCPLYVPQVPHTGCQWYEHKEPFCIFSEIATICWDANPFDEHHAILKPSGLTAAVPYNDSIEHLLLCQWKHIYFLVLNGGQSPLLPKVIPVVILSPEEHKEPSAGGRQHSQLHCDAKNQRGKPKHLCAWKCKQHKVKWRIKNKHHKELLSASRHKLPGATCRWTLTIHHLWFFISKWKDHIHELSSLKQSTWSSTSLHTCCQGILKTLRMLPKSRVERCAKTLTTSIERAAALVESWLVRKKLRIPWNFTFRRQGFQSRRHLFKKHLSCIPSSLKLRNKSRCPKSHLRLL